MPGSLLLDGVPLFYEQDEIENFVVEFVGEISNLLGDLFGKSHIIFRHRAQARVSQSNIPQEKGGQRNQRLFESNYFSVMAPKLPHHLLDIL